MKERNYSFAAMRERIFNIRVRVARLLCFMTALLVLNGSIDFADPVDTQTRHGYDYTEDLGFNDIESIYEYIAEECLDLEDFVPELEDNDEEDEAHGKDPGHWIATQVNRFQLHTQAAGKLLYPAWYNHIALSNSAAGIEQPPEYIS